MIWLDEHDTPDPDSPDPSGRWRRLLLWRAANGRRHRRTDPLYLDHLALVRQEALVSRRLQPAVFTQSLIFCYCCALSTAGTTRLASSKFEVIFLYPYPTCIGRGLV